MTYRLYIKYTPRRGQRKDRYPEEYEAVTITPEDFEKHSLEPSLPNARTIAGLKAVMHPGGRRVSYYDAETGEEVPLPDYPFSGGARPIPTLANREMPCLD